MVSIPKPIQPDIIPPISEMKNSIMVRERVRSRVILGYWHLKRIEKNTTCVKIKATVLKVMISSSGLLSGKTVMPRVTPVIPPSMQIGRMLLRKSLLLSRYHLKVPRLIPYA